MFSRLIQASFGAFIPACLKRSKTRERTLQQRIPRLSVSWIKGCELEERTLWEHSARREDIGGQRKEGVMECDIGVSNINRVLLATPRKNMRRSTWTILSTVSERRPFLFARSILGISFFQRFNLWEKTERSTLGSIVMVMLALCLYFKLVSSNNRPEGHPSGLRVVVRMSFAFDFDILCSVPASSHWPYQCGSSSLRWYYCA